MREMVDGCCDWVGGGFVGVREYGPAWAEDVVIDRVIKAGDLPTIEGDLITMGA